MAYIPYNLRRLQVIKFEIEFYQKANGETPAEEFLCSLDKKLRAKFAGLILILKDKGNSLREPYSKHLEDGIYELRGKVGTDIARVLYFFYYDGKIILTNGFVKKTQKTQREEILKAKEYRKDYIERSSKNEKI